MTPNGRFWAAMYGALAGDGDRAAWNIERGRRLRAAGCLFWARAEFNMS